jgi:hypothetical protein
MALVPFSSVDRSALRWLRSADKPAEFTLLSGDAPVATLAWAKHGGSLATATTTQGRWTFKRVGFLSPIVTVRREGENENAAVLTAHFRRHEIQVQGGGMYRLYHDSHILPGWSLAAADGREVLHIEPVAERRSLAGGAVVVSGSPDPAELLLVAVLSWYFIVLAWLEDELVEALAPFEGPDAPVRPGWTR